MGHHAAYLKNVEFINNHNIDYDAGKYSFWCGVNEWSDLTDEEYDARNSYRLPTEPIKGPVRNGDPSTAPDSACDHQKTSDNQNVAATCSGPSSVGASEGALEEAVGNVGPISICLCASGSFGQYSGGIFDDTSCSHSINHAVACVGYDNAQDFWIVRNSWGASWGESGYIRMKKKGQNLCGMLSNSCYPNL